VSTQRERQFNRDQYGNRFSKPCARPKTPLSRRLNRFLIKTEVPIERTNDLRITNGAIRQHHSLDPNDTLNLRAHRFSRVPGTDLTKGLRRQNAIAGSIDTTSSAATLSWPKTVTLPRP
ncbi:uncharacterized protein METZ01_LOCUS178408, partial [marine metagenome]